MTPGEQHPPADTRRPVFSIIIPTYDRPGRLGECLGALTRLDYSPSAFEVLVVDDGGRASALEVAEQFQRDLPVRVLSQAHAGPAAARNTGAANARGRFLAFTDDDCLPAPTWLSVLERHLTEDPDALIGGRTLNVLIDNPYSTASQLLIDYLYAYYNVDTQAATFFASNNMAISAAHFAAVGGFDTGFPLPAAEDRDFCDRWRHGGGQLRYADAAVIHHQHALGLRSFARQHFRYGRGASHFHALRAARSGTSIQLEPPLFYLNLLRYPFTRAPFRRAVRLCGLLALSQIANAAGYAVARLTRDAAPSHGRRRGRGPLSNAS